MDPEKKYLDSSGEKLHFGVITEREHQQLQLYPDLVKALAALLRECNAHLDSHDDPCMQKHADDCRDLLTKIAKLEKRD